MKYYNLTNVATLAQSIEVRKKLEESGYYYRSNTDLPEDFVLLLKIKFPGLRFVRVSKVCSSSEPRRPISSDEV